MKALYEKYKTAFLFTAIAVVIIIVGFYFLGGDEPASLVSERPSGNTSQEVGRDLLAQLLELRSLSLDAALFSNPAFDTLNDFSQPLSPQPVGRDNPFAPVGQ